jgi:hypothetical protein
VDEDIVIPIAFFMTVIALGIPLIRALSRRWELQRLPAAERNDTTARLERIEQAVDAIAIEVERLAESQRFVARLMSERSDRDVLPAASDRSLHDARQESA